MPVLAHRLSVVTVVLLFCAMQAFALEERRDPEVYFFQQSLGDFTEELALAREEGKKGVLLFFEMDECPFCRRMKNTILNRPDVQDWYQAHFLCFTVDVEGDIEIVDFQGDTMTSKAFAEENRVRATPVLAFFDLEGERIAKYTGAVRDAEEFLWLGEFVAEGHYATTNFNRYKRARKAAARNSQ